MTGENKNEQNMNNMNNMNNMVTHGSRELWLTVETGNPFVNLRGLSNCMESRLNRHFDIPLPALTSLWSGVKTMDGHGRYAFPQFIVQVENLSFAKRISIVWDKIYFRDKKKARLKFFSDENGWCWLNEFADDRIVALFLMDVRNGIFDYIDGVKAYGGMMAKKDFYICSRNKSNIQDVVCLERIPMR